MEFKYDVAVSFAGKQRPYVEKTVIAAKSRGLKVYYDRDMANELWGANFIVEQRKVYGQHARFVVVFLSKEYLSRVVPMDELFAAMTQDVRRQGSCILPVLVGKVDVPPSLISPHIGYLEAKNFTPDQLAHELHIKVSNSKALGRTKQEDGLPASRARTRRVSIALLAAVAAIVAVVLIAQSIGPAPRPRLMETPRPASSAPPTSSSYASTSSPRESPGGTGPEVQAPPPSTTSPPPPVTPPTTRTSRGEDGNGSSCGEHCNWLPF